MVAIAAILSGCRIFQIGRGPKVVLWVGPLMKKKLINDTIEYGCFNCGEFISADQLLNAIKYNGEVYFRLNPEFPDYYISDSLQVLSARRGGKVKTLKPQNVGAQGWSEGKYKKPCWVVGVKTEDGKVKTRTLTSLKQMVKGE
jgi:hypothetical protein